MRYVRKYSVDNTSAIRAQYRELSQKKLPVLICANHLTMIDSAILHWALATPLDYFLHYNRFAWNLPAVENFGSTIIKRIVTYLSKCILIDRTGTKEHFEKILGKVVWLMRSGEPCMIFPEGTRSRTGKIDPENVAYGIGQIISHTPECLVLCAYLRANDQENYSDLPAKGSHFYLELSVIRPETSETGRRAHRDLANQVITRLKEMEIEYFNQHRQ